MTTALAQGKPATGNRQQQPLFIGYGNLETMMGDLPAGEREVYVQLTIAHEPTRDGITYNTYEVTVQSVTDRGVVYCKIPVAETQTLGGHFFGDTTKQERHVEQAYLAEKIIREQLTNRLGAVVRDALIAMPEGMTYIDGRAGFLRYNKQIESFVVVEPSA